MSNVQSHPTWGIYDATKLQSFMCCPRQHFYEYVLGWVPDKPNVHLEFGVGWHLAMETLITKGYSLNSVVEGHALLTDHYRQFFGEQSDEIYHPKTPQQALIGLTKYIIEYADDEFEPVYTEIAGTVPISGKKVLHFKLDSILKEKGLYKSREHKTASALSRAWIDQWYLKMQVFVYNHVLYSVFNPNNVFGVEINGAIFSKKDVKFHRIPVRHQINVMEAWLWEVNDLMERIDNEYNRLMDCKADDEVMRAFPKNTENCTKYFGCPYEDFCIAWANPLSRVDEPPLNFIVERWNPAKEREKAKVIWDLG